MTSNFLFSITTGIYLVAFLLYSSSSIFGLTRFQKKILVLVAIGLVVNSWGFVKRVFEFHLLMKQSHPEPLPWTSLYQFFPVTNLYESLVLFAWSVVLGFIVLSRRYSLDSIGWAVMLVATSAMAYASGLSEPQSAIAPLVPALKSNWLLFHVITCFLAYAAFAVSASMAVVILIRSSKGNSSGEKLDELMYRVVLFGFFLLTCGIILGAVWANESWGSYWSWDPKETWSLITWIVFAAYLHTRRTRGWKGVPNAILVLAGFAVTLFCYLGVNLVLSGLHSYGSS